MYGAGHGPLDGERGVLGQVVRALSLAALVVVRLGSLLVTYRRLRAQPVLEGVAGAPDRTRVTHGQEVGVARLMGLGALRRPSRA